MEDTTKHDTTKNNTTKDVTRSNGVTQMNYMMLEECQSLKTETKYRIMDRFNHFHGHYKQSLSRAILYTNYESIWDVSVQYETMFADLGPLKRTADESWEDFCVFAQKVCKMQGDFLHFCITESPFPPTNPIYWDMHVIISVRPVTFIPIKSSADRADTWLWYCWFFDRAQCQPSDMQISVFSMAFEFDNSINEIIGRLNFY